MIVKINDDNNNVYDNEFSQKNNKMMRMNGMNHQKFGTKRNEQRRRQQRRRAWRN